jgi:chromosomal replication initiation ATPase DnaA
MIDLATIPTSELLEELKARQAELRRELTELEDAMTLRPVVCQVQAERIVAKAAPIWGIVAGRIYHQTRQAKIAEARQAVMFVLRNRYHYTFQEIGEALHRDHGTIIHGCNAIHDRMANEPDLANRVASLLESSH